MIAGATRTGDREGLRAATIRVLELPEDLNFSELLEVCFVDPVSIHFEFISETGGAEGKLLLSGDSGE